MSQGGVYVNITQIPLRTAEILTPYLIHVHSLATIQFMILTQIHSTNLFLEENMDRKTSA